MVRGARAPRATPPQRDWYVWADPRPDGSPPNDWTSVFDGPGLDARPRVRQYYLHQFLAEQPDLNWWNDEVRDAFDEILRFWFARGIAGLPDRRRPLDRQGPGAARPRHPARRPRRPSPLARARRRAGPAADPARRDAHPRARADDRVLRQRARTSSTSRSTSRSSTPASSAGAARRGRRDRARCSRQAAWPVWTGSNHDAGRFPTRWCDDDDARTRLALIALLTLRGTPVLYYGDEIGMTEVELRAGAAARPGRAPPLARRSRARPRCGRRCSGRPPAGAGFTDPGAEPWLPLGDHRRAQRRGPARRPGLDPRVQPRADRDCAAGIPDLRRRAPTASSTPPDGAWAWRRGEGVTVALNLSGRDVAVQGVDGTVAVVESRRAARRAVGGAVALAPWEGVVVESAERRNVSTGWTLYVRESTPKARYFARCRPPPATTHATKRCLGR